MQFDEDALVHAAARGDEAAQYSLAVHYLERSTRVEAVSDARSHTLLAGTFAMLAASNGLVHAVQLYIEILRALMRYGLPAAAHEKTERLVFNLSAAIDGKATDDRVAVAV